MHELKMALGGTSNRSYDPKNNMLEIEGTIFSDEVSNDNIGHEEDAEAQ